ncbi:hypothetical protein ACWCQL_20275 [Streptomyces sp. NPDC002073]|uniref:hypothetical protein n=1 Tax=Streptomyces sp. NBC_00239 TaxID=2903640 RepID=UPI002E2E6A7E|nr:hypothetical protein [Streptomyces sp. NBC_00239]
MSDRHRPRQQPAPPGTTQPDEPAPVTAVMRGAATASPSYSAATAKGAATALVRMLMEQGVFGYDAPAAPPEPEAAGVEATPWARMRTAVNQAEAGRDADGRTAAPVLSSASLMGEILHETARSRAVHR